MAVPDKPGDGTGDGSNLKESRSPMFQPNRVGYSVGVKINLAGKIGLTQAKGVPLRVHRKAIFRETASWISRSAIF